MQGNVSLGLNNSTHERERVREISSVNSEFSIRISACSLHSLIFQQVVLHIERFYQLPTDEFCATTECLNVLKPNEARANLF